MKRETREQGTDVARPKRTPLGTRNVLTVQTRPGYHRVWVSDSPSIRIGVADYESAGYTFVDEDIEVGDNSVNAAQKVTRRVTRPGGKGVTLYLMEQNLADYEADRAAEQEKIRQTEKEMFDSRSIEAGYGKIRTKDNHSESSGEF